MQAQLVVLGGGPGGYAAAFLAADLGFDVTLVEAEPRLGGVCLLRGCIPSKALLNVAKVIHDADHMDEWGVKFQPPAIDAQAMKARKEKVIDTLAGGLRNVAKNRKVRVIQARGVFANSTTLKLTSTSPEPLADDTLTFQYCIVATGSSPTKIPAFDVGSDRVMDSTGALELQDIPETMLIVGGGYIGLEMATVYAAIGSKVTVVELLDGLLMGADRDLVRPLEKKLKQTMAAIYTKTKVVSMANKGESIEVTFEGELAEKVQRFSRVLVSIGRKPNSQGIGLENTKVQLDKRGFVLVDKQQRTTDPHILAIGDVAGDPMLAHKAAAEGKVAVEALHGENVKFDPRAIPAVVFTDPEIAWAGITETEAKAEGIKYEAALFPWAASGRAQAVGKTDGLTKILVDPDTEVILGVGMVGSHVGDMIGEGVLAIEMGATIRDFTGSIHPHPTFSETLSASAEVFLGQATDLYKPKRKPAHGG